MVGLTPGKTLNIITHMEPTNNFDDFDTQIQSDELIPDGYEDHDGDYGYGEDCSVDIDGGYDADGYYGDDRPDLDNDAYGDDRDGYDGGDDFPW